MPLPIPDRPGQLFNNPDSYAMLFDDAWRREVNAPGAAELSDAAKKQRAMEACAEHPFALSDPAMASQVADFRIRLLGA